MDSVACVLIVSYYHNAMNRRSNFVGTSCALTRGLMKVGDTWSMLVLRDVALGLTKFDQLRASLGIATCARHVLAANSDVEDDSTESARSDSAGEPAE